jgi:hypothetical protein
LAEIFSKILTSVADMGYDESQYSLPRWMDLSISRQGMFDDTFQKIPSEVPFLTSPLAPRGEICPLG